MEMQSVLVTAHRTHAVMELIRPELNQGSYVMEEMMCRQKI
jgi:hypothetical protein